ncbi:TPA: hypothetical protein ACW7QV_003343 [Citrobacter braakii]|uniref:Uncharacterized protein n=1 Tax=Citrobacter braakii TaxID=57706 RepID=A0AAD1L4X0_CITBR|nr:hypothetical protein KAM621c_24270 [Citrobacter braakii]HEE0062735.1 hypothetical protein [Citrobacter braakii]HEE9823244.1 hypothetical protein [Citrobacter braakii]
MKLHDSAAQIALSNGGFLMAGDYTSIIGKGEVINVTERTGLVVECAECVSLINAPLVMVMAACREGKEQYMPFYSDMEFELPHQAAMAQMLNDAGEGFDLDDLVDIESLDAAVTVVRVEKWMHTE